MQACSQVEELQDSLLQSQQLQGQQAAVHRAVLEHCASDKAELQVRQLQPGLGQTGITSLTHLGCLQAALATAHQQLGQLRLQTTQADPSQQQQENKRARTGFVPAWPHARPY